MWYLIVSIPDLCNLTYFYYDMFRVRSVETFLFTIKIVSEYDQEIPQSQTADNPVAPRGRAAQPSQDIKTASVDKRNKFDKTFGPSINGLVTDGNIKLCCRGFILTLFQSTTANKIDSEPTRDYKI